MRRGSFIILLFSFLTIIGCEPDYSNRVKRYKALVPQLEELVDELESVDKEVGVLYKINDLGSEISARIHGLGLLNFQYFTFNQSSCYDYPTLELIFGNNEHLVFDCGLGLVNDTSGLVKSFDLSRGWVYWISTDFIG